MRTPSPASRTERVREPSATATIDHLLGAITSEGPPRSRALSRPVRSAVQYLERNAGTRPTLTGAAAEAHLSPSRLTHLFTQEVGIPFRRYGLWVRLRAVADTSRPDPTSPVRRSRPASVTPRI